MSEINYRMAVPEDAKDIALLFDMANAGLIAETWGQEASEGESWLDVALRYITTPHSEVSYARTLVAELDGKVIGMLICTPQQADFKLDNVDAMAENQRAFPVLRNKMPGAFLLRDMAVYPQYRGHRVATQLLDLGIGMAYNMKFETVFAIVHETNTKLLAHYDKRGLKVVASHVAGPHPSYPPESRWLLLTCQKPDGLMNDAYKKAFSHGE